MIGEKKKASKQLVTTMHNDILEKIEDAPRVSKDVELKDLREDWD